MQPSHRGARRPVQNTDARTLMKKARRPSRIALMPHTIDVMVGKRIRLRRLQLTLSQTDLARKLGLTFQQVQKYEKGTNRVSCSRLYEIANILKVPVSFFFSD